MKLLLPAVLASAALMAGCSTPSSTAAPLIPDKAIQLTANKAITLADMAAAVIIPAAIYFIYDPLAPNWEIEETHVSDDTYRLSMTMKRYHTGGAGESLQAFKRRADQLVMANGYGGYQLIEYTEGIDSQTLGARRVANGTIRLVQRRQADSFSLNE